MGSISNPPQPLNITVEFTGGLESLFSNKRKHTLSVPATTAVTGEPTTISSLVHHLVENVMQDQRRELFVLDGAIRPGILVLINDADWELEGEEKYRIQQGDNILFVSTLHGG
ncbi:hypothetical protein PABG_06967 [Paracoccidioides brasiliensis Pb03]|uniref:Ubiquitin-related modifier 1 n=2 Tax=Paracoccidioides brasiliensis TaxID=121759 RepID=C1GGW9_PARBD|nr:uncharacterized protein PADG_06188 [Paracoccidioides brasiliensis Pb18]EEH16880.1 hypothetical protein PABG_06967 [Paracoccidioides brasiliensis Pb03]EEH50109.1 hypothetical protein PADG_06188 [Paracoccidioides brasiliensis Pb18]ODH36467.1 hypothetical protein ACO22_02749 [Paracoccidioides brasiliensis]ODH48133.1 hypothetical protein GX48_05728 [Paracoccidioides brasiliensis]